MNKINLYAYKFNQDSTKSLDELQNSKVYKLWKKAETNELTTEDKIWITNNVNTNGFFRNGSIPFMGWAFDFAPILKEYWVKFTCFDIHAYLSTDKEILETYLQDYVCTEDYINIEIR